MKKTVYLIAFVVLVVTSISLQSFTSASSKKKTVVKEVTGYCVANEHLEDICDMFISSCRKASIRTQFPGQFLKVKIRDVRNGTTKHHKKAWKLLNDNRFKKK